MNVLIKEIHETVRECKPWVKFGVSPFGIYRNKKNEPNGSDTRGRQNYDDLDVYKRQLLMKRVWAMSPFFPLGRKVQKVKSVVSVTLMGPSYTRCV